MKSEQEIVHGLVTSYVHKGCRCDECRAANTRYMREWRARNPEIADLRRARNREWQRRKREAQRAQ